MSIQAFLYRRLCRLITCEFRLQQEVKVALKSKYEIASFSDVFCHPFYWQVFRWVDQSPNLIVDCGAHCGHFSVLADLCFRSKFKETNAKYILVEPNPYLLNTIQKNVLDAGMAKRVLLKHALLGAQSGQGEIWINHKNYLETSSSHRSGATLTSVPYLNLLDVVGQQPIDLLKVDIEGGEFEFVEANLELLKQVKLIFMELHQAPKEKHTTLFNSLKSVGLHLAEAPVECHGQQLLIFQRPVS